MTSNEYLNNEKSSFRRIIECSLAGIYIYDFDQKNNTYINPQYTTIIGHTPESMLKMNEGEFMKLFHPDDLPAITSHMEEILGLKDEEFSEIEYRFHHTDGHWVWCFSRDTVFDRREDGTVKSFLGTFLDITMHKDREQELEAKVAKRTKKLEQALADVKLLKDMLPICCMCKKIRDDDGYWHQVESYIKKQTGTDFSHSYCPECADRILSEIK